MNMENIRYGHDHMHAGHHSGERGSRKPPLRTLSRQFSGTVCYTVNMLVIHDLYFEGKKRARADSNYEWS